MCYEQLQLVWLLVLEAGMVVNLAEGLVETRQYTTGLLDLHQKTGCVLQIREWLSSVKSSKQL